MLETVIKTVSIEHLKIMPIMELAEEYPLLVDDQEIDLIASVEINGIREPLVLFKDSEGDVFLLDGRNRLSAAIKAELEEIPVRYFTGSIEEAEDLIIDLNEKRRHLLPVQRAYIADKHRGIVAARAHERRLATQSNKAAEELRAEVPGVGTSEADQESQETGKTREILARKHNVGKNAIDTAQKIRRVSEETMQNPDGEGKVLTPRAIKASSILNKMQKGTITISDATKNVFGEPGQDIQPEEQNKISTAKGRINKIVNDLLNEFDSCAWILIDIGNEIDQEFVYAKLRRLNFFMAAMTSKYESGDNDNLMDPEKNRDYWSEVEGRSV